MLGTHRPVLVGDLFGPDRAALVELLRSLQPSQWQRPTICPGWSVKDVALHVLGGDIGNIAGRRDGIWGVAHQAGETMGTFIGRINQEWVTAARRMSPRLIVELLEWSGPLLFDHLAGLDPMGQGTEVSWAGPGPAVAWLDAAREYTERWLHQQHIRDAVGVPGQQEATFFEPVIATFVHALPLALAPAGVPVGSTLEVLVGGDGGGEWTVVRESGEGPVGGWVLRTGRDGRATARIRMDADSAWRLFTLGLDEQQAGERVRREGDPTLAALALRAVAIVV